VRDTGLVALVLVAVVSALMVFKSVCGSQAVAVTTCPSSPRARLAKQDHPAYIPQNGYSPTGGIAVGDVTGQLSSQPKRSAGAQDSLISQLCSPLMLGTVPPGHSPL
jgi:hypothetical protein